IRPGRIRRLARRQESDRHRQLLRGLDQVRECHGLVADGRARRWSATNRGVLSPALRPLRRHARTDAGRARVTAPRIPFLTLTPGEDAAAVRTAIERVVARGWF